MDRSLLTPRSKSKSKSSPVSNVSSRRKQLPARRNALLRRFEKWRQSELRNAMVLGKEEEEPVLGKEETVIGEEKEVLGENKDCDDWNKTSQWFTGNLGFVICKSKTIRNEDYDDFDDLDDSDDSDELRSLQNEDSDDGLEDDPLGRVIRKYFVTNTDFDYSQYVIGFMKAIMRFGRCITAGFCRFVTFLPSKNKET